MRDKENIHHIKKILFTVLYKMIPNMMPLTQWEPQQGAIKKVLFAKILHKILAQTRRKLEPYFFVASYGGCGYVRGIIFGIIL